MQILQQQRISRFGCERGFLGWKKSGLMFAFMATTVLPLSAGEGQQGSAPANPRPIVIPNRTLDSHELNDLAEKNVRKKNFEAANEARKRAIEDEANKLLILARDLKAKTDNLGSGPLPPLLVREAEVIEILANDVKEKMKLTVNGD
ncbi:MAG TPA: hypothetical protein VGI45_09545 [Terracidiphilus sp.]